MTNTFSNAGSPYAPPLTSVLGKMRKYSGAQVGVLLFGLFPGVIFLIVLGIINWHQDEAGRGMLGGIVIFFGILVLAWFFWMRSIALSFGDSGEQSTRRPKRRS
jgi:hypothetical protein